VFPHPEAVARAAGAEDILQQVRCVATLEEAIAHAHHVVGTSARTRSLPWPIKPVREWVMDYQASSTTGTLAIVFGAERVGLTNEQLHKCHTHIYIPANPDYSSLNLASAVQLVCYELRLGFCNNLPLLSEVGISPKATSFEMEGFFEQLERTLYHTKFIDPLKPKQLLARLRRIFFRAELEPQEVNILRGILTSVEKLKSN
jgi:tRNA (cytidine32/uridine32-2'-O)-methyltransferase